MQIIERSLQEIGASLLISLPKGWTKTMHLKKGSSVKMLLGDDGKLLLAPELTKKESRKEATITFDEHLRRRFFKDYFEGNEKITITFAKPLKGREQKELYEFIKRFMNIQIIEEDERQLVLKAFHINELSSEECLKRMYGLTRALMQATLENAPLTQRNELRDALTRFYYLLVLQVRRFLSEGTYTENNQISLIRAMDSRMVAEKIQRIGELCTRPDINAQEKHLTTAIDYYERACSTFITSDFEPPLPLWNEGRILQKKCAPSPTAQIVRLAREISMLVR